MLVIQLKCVIYTQKWLFIITSQYLNIVFNILLI